MFHEAAARLVRAKGFAWELAMNRLVGLAVLCASSSFALADDWTIHATCDNQFAIYFGSSTATDFAAGSGNNWGATYTFTATGRDPSNYIYVATASDQTQAQGFIGDFTNTTAGRIAVTGDDLWQVFPAGAFLSQMGLGSGPWPASLMPTQAQVDTAIAYATANNLWRAPGLGGLNGVGPWGTRPDISPNARWIWNNSNGSPDPTQGSVNHDEFLVFRVTGAAPTPGAFALLAFAGAAGARRKRR